MSKTTHTPGPWRAHFNVPTAAIPGHIIKADNEAETPIASLWVGGGTRGVETQIANAGLIAAAPDLLAALEALSSNPCINLGDLIYHVREREGKGWDGPAVTAWGEAVEKAKAAVAKAKGEL
jgi:hypothetical protein